MTLVQAISTLSDADDKIMRRLGYWRPPGWVRWWVVAATRGGDGWLWYSCGALTLAIGKPGCYAACAAAALAAVAGILVFRALKKKIGRKRPCDIAPHAWVTLRPPDPFSFPSGHSIIAFAVTVPLGLFYPPMAPVLLLLAACVAISRVLLGMHFLTDVAAGSALGAALGYAAFLLVV